MELKKEVVLRRSFTVLAAKQNSIFKLQKHSCQIPCCKIVCLLLLLMSIYLYFLQVFNTTWIQIHNRNTRIWFSELWNFEVQHSKWVKWCFTRWCIWPCLNVFSKNVKNLDSVCFTRGFSRKISNRLLFMSPP